MALDSIASLVAVAVACLPVHLLPYSSSGLREKVSIATDERAQAT